MAKMTRKPTHPGTVFLEDVMKPLNLSVTKTAQLLGISRKALSEFINEKSSLSPDMALRISIATGTSAESWRNMQRFDSDSGYLLFWALTILSPVIYYQLIVFWR